MGNLLLFFLDVLNAPIISLYVVASLWAYVKLTLNEWDIKNYNITYNDCYKNNQWWRILSSPLFHSSFFHYILNISTLWSLRFIENLYGSIFLFKYTIIIGIFESVMSLYAINFIIRYARIDRTFVGHPIINSSLFGLTSILLGWLGFLSIDLSMKNYDVLFYLFGVIPLPIAIAPILIMLISQCMVPRTHSISHAGGLAAGYLLAFGILKILPNMYWTYCFFIDIVLFFSYLELVNPLENQRRNLNRNFHQNNDSDDIIEIITLNVDNENNQYRNRDENDNLDEMESQPLIQAR